MDIGEACAEYQDGAMQHLACQRHQCDEIWSFIGAKAKHVKPGHPEDFGDVWTWVAIDADTKLVPSWYIGGRTTTDALEFMRAVASRLDTRVQLTTDGHQPYIIAVSRAFENQIDYATIQKLYGPDPAEDQKRYSPAKCIGIEKNVIIGEPDPRHVSTSYVERQNLTMRMNMRRFTRLTNAFSRKIENHAAAVALHFQFYNFARPHKSLKNPYPRQTEASCCEHPTQFGQQCVQTQIPRRQRSRRVSFSLSLPPGAPAICHCCRVRSKE